MKGTLNLTTLAATGIYAAIALAAAFTVRHFGLNLAWAAIPVLGSIPLVSRLHVR